MPMSNVNLEKETNNKMLRRREMLVSFSFSDATPSRAEIKKELADKFNLKHDSLVVVRSLQLYGTKKGRVLVHEYSDAEALKVAQKYTLTRPNPKKGAAAAPQKQEAAKQQEAPKKEAAPKQEAAAKPEAAAAAPKERKEEKKDEKKADEAKKA